MKFRGTLGLCLWLAAVAGISAAEPLPRDAFGRTALHLAVPAGTDAVAALLAKGADANACDEDARTPLHVAALMGSVEVARLLIKHGADGTAQTANGDTPLHLAVEAGRVEVACVLAEQIPALAIKNKRGLTPLALAEKRSNNTLANLLRAAGGQTALSGTGELAGQLGDADRLRAHAAEQRLVALGKEAVVPVLAILADPQQSIEARKRATTTLGQLRAAEAVPVLCAELKNEKSPVRVEAATALGRIGDKQAVEALLWAVQRESSVGKLRVQICWALGELKDPRALWQLTNVCRTALDPVARDEAMLALDKMTGQKHGGDMRARMDWITKHHPDWLKASEAPQAHPLFRSLIWYFVVGIALAVAAFWYFCRS